MCTAANGSDPPPGFGINTDSAIDRTLLGSLGENVAKLGTMLPLSYQSPYVQLKKIDRHRRFEWILLS